MTSKIEKSRQVEDARHESAQLIEQIKSLKEIKPRKEWVVLLKSQILAEKQLEINIVKRSEAKSVGVLDILYSVFFQRKLAYSFAVALLMVLGAFGFAQNTVPGDLLFPVKKISEQSQAALTGHTGLKQNAVVLNNRINDLVQVAKAGKNNNISSAIDEIKANAIELAKDLEDNTADDPQTLKEIAVSLKTLAAIPGTDLASSPGIEALYQIVAQQQVDELKKATLTVGQQEILVEVEDLYNKGNYSVALEKIWDLSNNQPDPTDPADPIDSIDTTTEANQ